MTYSICSLNVGKPKALHYQGKEIITGFGKHPVNEGVFLSAYGFKGDGQADLKNHGGKDKAVLLYPYSHYYFWEKHYDRPFLLPSFGENITIDEITENQVSIGDIFQLGEAVVQVSQPRHPCYKIAAFLELKDVTAMVTETGYSGFYVRVLEEGKVYPDSKLVFEQPGESDLTIAEVFQVSAQAKQTIEIIDKVLASKEAAISLKEELQRKKEKIRG